MAGDLGLGKRTATPAQQTDDNPLPISEVEEVRNALIKANQLIQERSNERDRVEADLRQMSDRLDLAQEAAHVGSFERDLLTDKIIWSASQEKLYGLAPGSFRGTYEDWAKRIHPDDNAAVEDAVRQAVETKSSINLEFRVIHPDGTMRWLASQARVFADEQGNARRLLGVNIDITERKRAEAVLKRSNEDLEKRVAEQTAKLIDATDLLRGMEQQRKLEEQLRQSQRWKLSERSPPALPMILTTSWELSSAMPKTCCTQMVMIVKTVPGLWK